MSFIKISNTVRLAYWEDGKVTRTASVSKSASYFAEAENSSKLDVGAMLSKVAGEYDISSNPKDYLFEAVRAVTAGVPNENGDAFHKNELLRYDHRLRQAVYQTFILKPHHVNHRADNPKTARGVILDAHYNDSSPALDSCPNCQSRTAAIEERDSTGLYCRKCGHTVKDEFIEILIAVDKAKDPNFAEGVRTGVLNATSMGCICDSTTCNVCEHVAYNRNEFCGHIRGGNKKRTFRTAAGDKVAFEWCNNVCFTEDSRVDQPADPKALQQEILHLAARKDAISGDIARETDVLILQKQINDLQARVAQLLPPTDQSPDIPAGTSGVSSQPGSIETFVEGQNNKLQHMEPMSKEEMGILDTPAASSGDGLGTKASLDQNIIDELDNLAQRYASQHHSDAEGVKMDLKFKSAYSNVRATTTKQGNVRVSTPAGTLFVVKPSSELTTAEDRKAFSLTVLAHIAEHGLIPTMRAFEATKGAKFAQILEHHVEDFAKGRETGDTKPAVEGGDTDGVAVERGEPPTTAVGEQASDRKEQIYENKTQNDSMLGGHQEDFEKGNRPDKKFPGSVQDDGDMDNKDGYPKKNLSDSPLDGITLNHTQKVAQAETSKPSTSKPSASKPPSSKGSKPSAPKASKPSTDTSKPASKEAAPPAAPASTPVPPTTPEATTPGAEPTPEMLAQQWVAIQSMIQELTSQGQAVMGQLSPMLKEIEGKSVRVGEQLYKLVENPGVEVNHKMVLFHLMPELEQKVQTMVQMLAQAYTTTQPTTSLRPVRGQMEGAELMAAAKDILGILDQMLASMAPDTGLAGTPANDDMDTPVDEGMQMAASKKGLPSFIKNKRGGSGDTKTSRPSTSSTEKANSDMPSKKGELTREAELKQLELRLERLYKSKIAKLETEAKKREASITDKLATKFTRALKLAAKRQALNLEQSPIKAAMADVLMNPMDLGHGEYYPGMDEQLTVTLIERSASLGMDEFIDKTIGRAAELTKLSDEAFGQIEADLKNLQPIQPAVVEVESDGRQASHARQAAREGNMQLAPLPSETQRHDRGQLQHALGTTKVHRHASRVFNR